MAGRGEVSETRQVVSVLVLEFEEKNILEQSVLGAYFVAFCQISDTEHLT